MPRFNEGEFEESFKSAIDRIINETFGNDMSEEEQLAAVAMPNDPRSIARLISEDIRTNNGFLFKEDITPDLLPLKKRSNDAINEASIAERFDETGWKSEGSAEADMDHDQGWVSKGRKEKNYLELLGMSTDDLTELTPELARELVAKANAATAAAGGRQEINPKDKEKNDKEERARKAFYHARDVIKGPWPEGEPIILQDPRWTFYYIQDVIKGPWPKGEPTILQDPRWAYWYALEIIKGPWPKGEEIIKRYESEQRMKSKNERPVEPTDCKLVIRIVDKVSPESDDGLEMEVLTGKSEGIQKMLRFTNNSKNDMVIRVCQSKNVDPEQYLSSDYIVTMALMRSGHAKPIASGYFDWNGFLYDGE